MSLGNGSADTMRHLSRPLPGRFDDAAAKSEPWRLCQRDRYGNSTTLAPKFTAFLENALLAGEALRNLRDLDPESAFVWQWACNDPSLLGEIAFHLGISKMRAVRAWRRAQQYFRSLESEKLSE